jgi:CHAT domain-containing protein/cytochrome c-type biogenesis protein CcmH/NrfG
MTVEEVLRLLHSRARPGKEDRELKLEEHLRHCDPCNQVVKDYQRLMSRLYENRDAEPSGGRCPDPAVWGELACGLVAQEDATRHLEHAASCSSCTEELLYALDALSTNEPAPDDLKQNLRTGTVDWQRDFAAKIAARQQSHRMAQPVSVPKRSRLVFPKWAFAGLAAVVALAAGLGLFRWLQGESAEKLIQEAYAQQRTVEMRLPGAGYGPVRVERAANRPQINSPRALLEAEVLIKKGLEKRPDDVELLRQEAESDLLNWNYQPALETLNRASRLRPGSFELLLDTATAYFERAEATANPADYEAGLQFLSDAIRLKPDDPAALFNRAILCERLYFYTRAIADWEQFLKIEKDPGWRKEAEQRLQELRERLRKQGVRRDPDRLAPPEFRRDLASLDPSDPEEFAEAAERRILPEISRSQPEDENYRAASALANILESRHSEPFLKDLLQSSANPGFHRAAALLGQSSSLNHTGQYEQAYASALQSAARFQKFANSAGVLAAQFEQLYALQFEGKARPCVAEAARAVDVARASRYALLEVQLLLEQAICSNMNGDLKNAKELMLAALALAKGHGYASFYVRGLTALADLEDQEGDEAGAWSAIQEGLGLYWSRGLPPVRGYSLYVALDSIAERLGHYNVQFAAGYEAVDFGFANPDPNVQAWMRARLANAALRTGELAIAQTEFERALEIFGGAPNTGSVRWRELDARVGLARVQMLKGENLAESAESLEASLPQVEGLSNRYVESQYYETLAELKWRLQDARGTRQFLDKALRIAETGLTSLPVWRERLAWMEQHRDTYILMTQVLLSTGDQQSALDLWEHFRSPDPVQRPSAPTTALRGRRLKFTIVADQPRSETVVLTYAVGPQFLVIWVRDENEVHFASVPEAHDLRQTAESFISECSRPDSALAGLQADAHMLYGWLIAPVKQWIPKQGHLIVEPDGILNGVPFEALMDPENNYLGTRYSITVANSVRAKPQIDEVELLQGLKKALIVAAPAALNAPAEPPPGALQEAFRVAQDFSNPVLLTGRQATTSAVRHELSKSQIFHFAGHAMVGRHGAAMIMADGLLGLDQTRDFSSRHLDHLKLAVFSACDTARASERLQSDGLVSEFLHAGAANVVASRWNVDSVTTTDFMDLLYASVLSGNSVADSSRAAAQAIRKMPGRSHPYYWAAFSSFGSS